MPIAMDVNVKTVFEELSMPTVYAHVPTTGLVLPMEPALFVTLPLHLPISALAEELLVLTVSLVVAINALMEELSMPTIVHATVLLLMLIILSLEIVPRASILVKISVMVVVMSLIVSDVPVTQTGEVPIVDSALPQIQFVLMEELSTPQHARADVMEIGEVPTVRHVDSFVMAEPRQQIPRALFVIAMLPGEVQLALIAQELKLSVHVEH